MLRCRMVGHWLAARAGGAAPQLPLNKTDRGLSSVALVASAFHAAAGRAWLSIGVAESLSIGLRGVAVSRMAA